MKILQNISQNLNEINFFKLKTDDVFTGLQKNGLLNTYTHLLTGYIGKDSFLTEVGNIVKTIRKDNPKIIYGWYQSGLIRKKAIE